LTRELFFEDQTQIFLMGLRYYTTGAWPYFGPDVVWTKSEIPGALQALLVGLPFRILAVPEAPYVLVNLLSMAALAAFAWYLTARIPQLPKWLVWGWLMTLPWTIEYSTHIINPSYMLPAAIVFFIGFFEAAQWFRLGRIPKPLAFVLMGAATSWTMQVHMSWPLLLPYAGVAWLSRWRDGPRSALANAAGFVGGLLIFGVFLIPTFVVFGIHAGSGGTASSLRPHWINPGIVFTVLARLLSFASFEIWRFIDLGDAQRMVFLLRHLWIVPLAVVLWVASLWQPVWMLREWFRTRSPHPEWPALKWLVAGTVVLVSVSYAFVMEPNQAHAFYVVAPIGFMFAAYCWTFVDSPRWRQIAAALLAANVAFHVGQAWIQAPTKSLYRNRHAVAEAVRMKQPEMFAHRRPFAIDAGPALLQLPSAPYDGRVDPRLTDVQHTLGYTLGSRRGVVLWTVTLTNSNARVAYRNVMYQTSYRDDSGRMIAQHYDYIQDIFQPGDVARLELIDGLIPTPFASATIEVLTAEAVLPIR